MSILLADAISDALADEVAAIPSLACFRRWFYTQDGERFGPVSGPELRATARLGFLGPKDLVRCGSDGTWISARDVRGLFDRRQ